MLGSPPLSDFSSLNILRTVLPLIGTKDLASSIGTASADERHDVV
ncbi:hypothetical protein BTIS_0996 [Bifidobacterium tissieri]|uniref:Uncharacterized protein n=1 Tax=Bifidobacterium tissieri TaxID=1630162 RepID=A0A261FFG4_9BIFI|nr:hypothetical protein BTIS_0996 [Bifidobacterium tissieri]